MVESSVSVQKFPGFIMVQRNQKSVVLSGLNSCFCEDVQNTRTWRVFAELVTFILRTARINIIMLKLSKVVMHYN